MRVIYESIEGIDTLEFEKITKIYPHVGNYDYLHQMSDAQVIVRKVDNTKYFLSEIEDAEFGDVLDAEVML